MRRAITKRKRERLERVRLELGARILRARREYGITSHYRDDLDETDTARGSLMSIAELAELVDQEF